MGMRLGTWKNGNFSESLSFEFCTLHIFTCWFSCQELLLCMGTMAGVSDPEAAMGLSSSSSFLEAWLSTGHLFCGQSQCLPQAASLLHAQATFLSMTGTIVSGQFIGLLPHSQFYFSMSLKQQCWIMIPSCVFYLLIPSFQICTMDKVNVSFCCGFLEKVACALWNIQVGSHETRDEI